MKGQPRRALPRCVLLGSPALPPNRRSESVSGAAVVSGGGRGGKVAAHLAAGAGGPPPNWKPPVLVAMGKVAMGKVARRLGQAAAHRNEKCSRNRWLLPGVAAKA